MKSFLFLLLVLIAPKFGYADGSLRNEMEAISQNFRKLNRQYADPAQKASSLELVAAMQKHAETAKTLTPSYAQKMTGDEQSKYLATFHKDIDELLKELATLRNALASDKTDVAKMEVEKIGKLRNASHKELGVQFENDRKRGGPPPPQGQ